MAAPIYLKGTFGNVINAVLAAHGTTIGGFFDASGAIECQFNCFVLPGSTQPGTLTAFGIYKVVGGYPIPITATGSGTLTISGTPANFGLFPKMLIGIQQASGSKLGEIAVITSIAGSVITVPTIVSGGYNAGDSIYCIAQTPTFTVSPSSPTGAYVASTPESSEISPGPAPWFVGANNADGAQSITVYVTADLITSIQ
jgi:hypothetical protein